MEEKQELMEKKVLLDVSSNRIISIISVIIWSKVFCVLRTSILLVSKKCRDKFLLVISHF